MKSDNLHAKEPLTECMLADIASIQTGPFGSQLHSRDYVKNGIPIVTVEHLGQRRFSEQNLPNVSLFDAERLSKYSLQEGDIVFSRVGSVDRCAYVFSQNDGWLFSGRCLRVRSRGVCSLFLYYYLSSREVREYVASVAVGATMPSINTSIMGEIKLKIPSLPTQRKIAAVLSSLDDKIETNHAICRNLEEQADAFYKQHFVSGEKSSWNEGKLSDLIDVKYGKDHKKLADGTIPVYGSGGLMRYAERALYESESVLIPRKGTLNNVMLVMEPFWTVDTMFYSVMKVKNAAKFVFHFLKGKDLASMNAGSAVPSMTTEILNSMELRLPPKAVLADFEHNVAPIYQTIATKKRENDCLAALRDTLLPRLMSGELDVSAVKL